MIIINQNKTEILNFDRITEIVVSDNNICVLDSIKQEQGFIIATYKTETRAKEVLKEIIQRYVHTPYKKYGNDYIKQNQIYEMPKE